MSQTYVGILVSLLGTFVIPRLGVDIGNDALTTTVSVLLTIGGALWALLRRYQAGGVNLAGLRK